MGTITLEIGRIRSLVIVGSRVFLATRPGGRTVRWRRAATPLHPEMPGRPDDNGLAHLRLSAMGRNRWDRVDLVRGVGSDHGLGEPRMVVWPARRARPAVG